MSNNRIALYLVSFSGGGAEREMIYLANEFAARGYIVDLIVHRNKGPLRKLISNNVNQVIIDKTYIHDVLALARYMQKEKPVFILSTLHLPNWALSVAKFISFTATKISWRIVISLSDSKKDGKGWITKFLKMCYPVFSLNVNKIICVSKGVADDLVSNFSISTGRVRVMYNPAYSPEIHTLAKEDICHRWFNEEYKTVVSLGRLSTQKDFKTLILSFKEVYRSIDNARLVIFGEGILKNDLQYFVDKLGLTDVVELFGFEINPYKYLAKADLFVLSSIYEGFGNVIVEALALNIPVVSTNCPSGPSEILENGKWGKLVEVGDESALALAIVASLASSTQQDTLRRAEDFSVKKVVDRYVDMMM
ncbi:glycosyltransferase [Photobacterium profundum]|uniref:glycosyltransferase n=1 Tax=Photobacterium profundum TaxID=74109 RepID=UPI003D0ABEBE